MKGALLPGTNADPPRGWFDPNTFYLEHLAELGTFFKRTARRLGIDAGEDTLQDVWIKLRANYERIDTSDPRVVVAWCKKAGTNHLLTLIRGGYHSYEEPHSNLAIIDAERERGANDDPAQQWAAGVDLRRSLVNMPDKLAEVFLLDADGYSRAEIAEMLGISPAAVGMRLTRARAYARNRLGAFVAGLLPGGALPQGLGRALRRVFGKPSQVFVTSIGSLSVVLAFGMPMGPGTVQLPAQSAQGVVVRTVAGVAGETAHARAGKQAGAHSTSPHATATAGRRDGKAAPASLVPQVPKTCAPHICVGSQCPDAHQAGDRIYIKPTDDPCGVEVTESYTPVCQHVPDNPVVGCHRDGHPQWTVDPPSPSIQGAPQ